jgi:hypothetical protein
MTGSEKSTSFPRRQRFVVIALVALGLILVIIFGLRTVRSYIRLQRTGLQPGVTDVEAIRGWMTVPYIATAYKVPEDYLFEQLDIPAEGNRDKSLRQLNREYALGQQAAILEAVKEAIKQYQRENPASTPKSP